MNFECDGKYKKWIMSGALGCILILAILYAFLLYRNNRTMKQEKRRLEMVVETWKSRFFHLEEVELKKIEYEGMRIPSTLCIESEKGKFVNLRNLIHDSNKTIIMRISEKNCLSCILSFNSILQNELTGVDVVYIVDYDTKKKRDYYKKMLNIDEEVYISKDIGIPIEKEECPYVFIIDNDFQLSHLFIPIYDNDKLSKKYIQTIKNNLEITD